jgi:hypothetical protein
MRDAEVGGDHVWIDSDFIGPAVGDFASVVKDDDMARKPHYDADIVFDQHHRDPKLCARLPDEPAHVFFLVLIHPGHGFVEEEKLRLADQRARQVDPFLHAIGQGRNNGFGMRRDFEKGDDCVGARAKRPVFRAVATDAEGGTSPGYGG